MTDLPDVCKTRNVLRQSRNSGRRAGELVRAGTVVEALQATLVDGHLNNRLVPLAPTTYKNENGYAEVNCVPQLRTLFLPSSRPPFGQYHKARQRLARDPR
jgi:hypothetical protein